LGEDLLEKRLRWSSELLVQRSSFVRSFDFTMSEKSFVANYGVEKCVGGSGGVSNGGFSRVVIIEPQCEVVKLLKTMVVPSNLCTWKDGVMSESMVTWQTLRTAARGRILAKDLGLKNHTGPKCGISPT
jgi:hypothetical protein